MVDKTPQNNSVEASSCAQEKVGFYLKNIEEELMQP